MTFTIIILVIFLLMQIILVCIQAAGLMLGLKWARAEEVTYSRSLKATFISILAQLSVASLFLYFASLGEPSVSEALVHLLLLVLAVTLPIKIIFGISALRTVQALIPMLFTTVIAIPFASLLFAPFVAEAFVVPTNSMAPTIVGSHIPETCSECEKNSFASIHQRHPSRKQNLPSICDDFHSNLVEKPRGEVKAGDRVLSAKFLAPKRWEIATFKYPGDPETNYVKRVVGLPGETVHIEDGSVFINGIRLSPPESISKIVYSDKSANGTPLHGTRDNPAVLGADEYFVLGDNTEQALDSRYWTRGAPGHNVYAVPESSFTGVVTTIYWPPSRWRALK